MLARSRLGGQTLRHCSWGRYFSMAHRRVAGALVALVLVALAAAGTAEARTFKVREFKLASARIDALQTRFVNQIQARYPQGSWAPMRYELSNRDLRLMGLPSR